MEYNTLRSNLSIPATLLRSVAETVAEQEPYQKIGECGPIEINRFSICFWVTLMAPTGRKCLYVKIPKVIYYDRAKQVLGPPSSDDIKLAEDEYDSLVYLSTHWDNSDIRVRFVKPLGFIRDFNAIITERISAKHLFKQFRKHDLLRRLLRSATRDPIPGTMSRLGTALARFHNSSGADILCDADSIVTKMKGYLVELNGYGVDAAYLEGVARKLDAWAGVTFSSQVAINLKGLDIRQVFIDESGFLHLLDPGKMKNGYREVDLARFVVTCRILYWGSAAILLRLTPAACYEESFLDGYSRASGRSEMALRILIVKELLKHWRMAHVSLDEKSWPHAYKVLLRKAYMDPFYKRQISSELTKWEAMNGLRKAH